MEAAAMPSHPDIWKSLYQKHQLHNTIKQMTHGALHHLHEQHYTSKRVGSFMTYQC